MAKPEQQDIEYIEGPVNILLIAPHGVETKPFDDINTAELTRKIQAELNCSAIINTAYRKPTGSETTNRNNGKFSKDKKVLDLNKVEQAGQLPEYLKFIKRAINKSGKTTVFWIHGAEDKNIKNADCYIGWGQSNANSVEKRYTASFELVLEFKNKLNENGLKAEMAPRASKYIGWSIDYMNQWFNKKGYPKKAQSIQLEFKYTGIRDTPKSLKSTAQKMASAIKTVNDPIQVDIAYSDLFEIFAKHYEKAMMEAGNYIIKNFYENDIEKARNKETTKQETLNQLYEIIVQNKDGNGPSKSKIYHAVNLVIQEHDIKKFCKDTFSTLRNISLSHKIYLLSVKDLEQKKKLIERVAYKQMTVRQLREQIETLPTTTPTPTSLLNHPVELSDKKNQKLVFDSLSNLSPKKLKAFREKVVQKDEAFSERIKGLEKDIALYNRHLKIMAHLRKKVDDAIQKAETATTKSKS